MEDLRCFQGHQNQHRSRRRHHPEDLHIQDSEWQISSEDMVYTVGGLSIDWLFLVRVM